MLVTDSGQLIRFAIDEVQRGAAPKALLCFELNKMNVSSPLLIQRGKR